MHTHMVDAAIPCPITLKMEQRNADNSVPLSQLMLFMAQTLLVRMSQQSEHSADMGGRRCAARETLYFY